MVVLMSITVLLRSGLLLSATLIVLCTVVACERAAPLPLDKAQPMSPLVQRLLQEGDEALRRHDFERAFALADSAVVHAASGLHRPPEEDAARGEVSARG